MFCDHFRPDNHLTAGPDCCVRCSCAGRVCRAGACPIVRPKMVSAASVEFLQSLIPAPHNHLTAGPDCGVEESGSGRVCRAGACPTVRVRIVSSAGVQVIRAITSTQTIISLPVKTAV